MPAPLAFFAAEGANPLRSLASEPQRSRPTRNAPRPLSAFHERIIAEELSLRSDSGSNRLTPALSEARVDLNPHQVEAAAFALDSLNRGGCVLADEVGLGKTIEAGIVLAQLIAEGKDKLLILCPATLRAQWKAELEDKFDLTPIIVDGPFCRTQRNNNPFHQKNPVICSIPFAAGRAGELRKIHWDLVVIDEAHRLRNAYKFSNVTGRALRGALQGRAKLLLTATPLQNDILELFGLMGFLDERLLGPEHAFRSKYLRHQGSLADQLHDRTLELKQRLGSVVQRTLRRQVKEYVRFTHRRSVVEDFALTAPEKELYQRVSDYLQRSDALAIEPGKKHLLALVFRKLLASSTYAIAPTLRKLADHLDERLAATPGENLELEEFGFYSEECEAWSEDSAKVVARDQLSAEAKELRECALLAESVRQNAKGEALGRALGRIFTIARSHRWPEKAVVFTESKRTQEYLFRLLSDSGFAGSISQLSGDAGAPEQRRKLIEEFRTKSKILLSTEAGAEGLNLQFCNIVVNYDLPWNPQRLEQRIGRCHRYGQERDVLVINFLNRQNAADARLYELLEKKLNLFDGVFGASDEILGALEGGVDFERRVLDIYQSCRSPDEINAAFDALRADLENRIDARMEETRSMLLERFDGEVRRRLRLTDQTVRGALARRKEESIALTHSVLGKKGVSREALAQAAAVVLQRPKDGVCYLRLDAASLPPHLAVLAGSEGWWFAFRFDFTALRTEQRLAHLVFVKKEDTYRALSLAEGDLFLQLPAVEEKRRRAPGVSITDELDAALTAARKQLQAEVMRANAREFDAARERADQYAEDCLLEARESAEAARLAWESARRELASSEKGSDEDKARSAVERLEARYRSQWIALRDAEAAQYAKKDTELSALRRRAALAEHHLLIASAYFWLV